MVTIDRERLISEKQNNKASREGARLPKEVMLLKDIFKFTKPSLNTFHPFGLISRACLIKLKVFNSMKNIKLFCSSEFIHIDPHLKWKRLISVLFRRLEYESQLQ